MHWFKETAPDAQTISPDVAALTIRKKEAAVKKRVGLESESEIDEESSEWGSETDDTSSVSDIDIEGKQMEELRIFFLK